MILGELTKPKSRFVGNGCISIAPLIRLVKRWIDEGGRWHAHWAYQRPRRPPLPRLSHPWPVNPIDVFTLRRMHQHGLHPAARAARETQIRRVTFDLTGMGKASPSHDPYDISIYDWLLSYVLTEE